MSNGSKVPLEEMTLRQLRLVASEYSVSRYSRMRKVQLVEAIRLAQAARGESTAAPTTTVATAAEKTATEATATEATATEATATEATATKATATEATATEATATEPDTNTTKAGLATVDDGFDDLPGGYGDSRIVLMPRDPQWAYVYWDIPGGHKEEIRRQGGVRLAIRFYDVTAIDINFVAPHSLQQYECDEMAREWFLPVPVSDRDYIAEIGYVAADGRWLMMARSTPIHVPPMYPSDWIEDHFVTVDWEEELTGKTVMTLTPPSKKIEGDTIYDEIFAKAQAMEAQRIAGSLFGSMHQVPEQAVSSFVFPSGVGMWALPTLSGMSSASALPSRPRQFWLATDAELIVYGATEPDATVTIGNRKIDLKPDGTFRFQMSFQDGLIDYPIKAVAADGEHIRSIHMKFTRETPERNTNIKAEAVEEWFAF